MILHDFRGPKCKDEPIGGVLSGKEPVRVPRGAHLYIKGWLPSHINVAVTANEMREGLSVSVCRHWHQTLCKLLQSETLILFQVMSKVCVGQFWRQAMQLPVYGMRHRGGRTVIQARWRNVGSRSRNAKGNAESDEQGRNVPKSASVADYPVVA